METSVIFRRIDSVMALDQILPACREAASQLRGLTLNASFPGWTDLFVRFWQQEVRCVAELEIKRRELGGHEPSVRPSESLSPVSIALDDPKNPFLLDKNLLLRCLNAQSHLVHLYSEFLRTPLTFDMRMILQRHHLQSKDTLDQLTRMYESYIPPLSHPEVSEPVLASFDN